MTTENVEAHDGVGLVNDNVGAPPVPAPGAEEQKPGDSPAPGAEEQKPDAAQETPEQEAERKLSRRQRAHQRERDKRVAAETEARLLREQLAKATSPAPQQDVEPKREDFPNLSYEEFLDKRQDWRMDQKLKDHGKAPNPGSEKVERQPVPESHKAWVEREAEFVKGTKDYQSVVDAFVEDDLSSLSGGARETILESDKGPQLLYHLAKHPDLVEGLEKLSPRHQVAELVKLEGELAKPPARKQTSAPSPPNPISGGRSSIPGYSENMSDAEYHDLRKGQGARWARH